ncbi:MAG: hypothetical protein RL033_7976 [Pseudomonadota bacterium]
MQSWYRFRARARSWRAGLAGLTSLLGAACCTSDARAEPGWGFGPVLAITASDSPSLGWELTALGDHPLWARWAVGGNYSWAVQGDDPAYLHYLVWEPWLYAGGTLGVALTDRFQPRVAYGAWEGVGVSLDGDLFESDERQWVVSLAIGWRAVGGTHQFYLTPKLWRMNGWRLNS